MTYWPLTNSDFPTNQTFHQFHDLDTDFDLHRIMSGFHGSFATGMACQQGTLTLLGTWFRPPFWNLLVFQLWRPDSSNLPCLYSTFHLEYPLVLSWFVFVSFPFNLFRFVSISCRTIYWPISDWDMHLQVRLWIRPFKMSWPFLYSNKG